MATLNISIPDNMKEWISAQTKNGKYTSASDYLRDLIRLDQREKERFEALLLEGLDSGDPAPVDATYWETKKQNLKQGQ